MSRLWIALLSFALVFSAWSVSAEQSGHVSVVASGTGPNRKAALDAALRSAIETAVGMTVRSSSQIVNAKLMRDSIMVDSAGQIDSYEVLEEDASTIGHVITLKAQVRPGTGQPVASSRKNHGGFGRKISADLYNHESGAQATVQKLATIFDRLLMEDIETAFQHKVDLKGEDIFIYISSFKAKIPQNYSRDIASAVRSVKDDIVTGYINASLQQAGCPVSSQGAVLLSSFLRASWLVIDVNGHVIHEQGPDMGSYDSKISNLSVFSSLTQTSSSGYSDHVTIQYPHVMRFGPFTKAEIESIDRLEFTLSKRCNYGGALSASEPL